jgi:hypothetical protein
MIITRMHLPRRTVLRGLGATLALPLLDSMVPAFTAVARTAAAPVRRFGVFYVPNGMSMAYWYPKGLAEGPLAELPPTLHSLNELKERVLLCGGLASEAARYLRGGDHIKSSGTFLTGMPFRDTGGADVFAAVSMDQIAAKELGKETQLTSLELGIEDPGELGSCDGGLSCAYTNTIAWRTATTPLPTENDPRAVFERLFGTTGTTDRAARLDRMKKDRSILDFVGAQAERLWNGIGPQDRIKISEYFDSVRDIERRIQMAEGQNTRELPLVNQAIGVPANYAEHAKLMMDLLALAYQTDLTRISTFMLAREVSNRPYPEVGVSDSHHPVSHHQDEPAKLERLSRINAYHFEQFAHLVKKLAATPEGDGTMLDHTVFLYGTGISDSNTHFHDDLPIALVAGQATGIKTGSYVRYPKQPLTNLHLMILERLGVPVEKLGDSTGKLQGLTSL